jgi:alpha-mannosidase
MEFNNPFIVRTAAPHSGELPPKWSLVEVSGDDVVTSALKPGANGKVVIRVYEAAGQSHKGVHAYWRTPISDVHEANLIEDSGAPLSAEHDSFTFDLKPYEIRTFKLKLKPVGTAKDYLSPR